MDQDRPLIREVYKDYTPPFNLSATIQDLLSCVPSNYISGLNEIVLTNAGALSRDRRRQRTQSGSRATEVRGLYHQVGNGQPAWIEIFVDTTLQDWPRPLLKMPFFRSFAISEVLYHEFGHHVQHVSNLKLDSKESSAEKLAGKLFRVFFRKRYWYLQPIIFPLRICFRIGRRVTRLLGRHAGLPA